MRFGLAHRRSATMLVAMLLSAHFIDACADDGWSSPWYASAQPTVTTTQIGGKPQSVVGFAANGDVLLSGRTFSGDDGTLTRFAADGALRWSSNLGPTSRMFASALTGGDDDGAFAAFALYPDANADAGGFLARIGPTGTRLWSHHAPTGWLVRVGSTRIASAGCVALSMLDVETGNVLWQRDYGSTDRDCHGGGLVGDDQGTLYAAFEMQTGEYSIAGSRLVRLDADGREIWNIPVMGSGIRAVPAVAGNVVMVADATTLQGRSTTDGRLLWQAPIADGESVLGANGSGDPVLVSHGALRQIASTTGSERWSRSMTVYGADVVGGALIVAGDSVLQRLDPANGAPVWSTPVSNASWLAAGGYDGTTFAVVRNREGLQPPEVLRFDFASGAQTGAPSVPPVAQPIVGTTVFTGDGRGFGIGVTLDADDFAIRVRAVDPTSGATDWEIADPQSNWMYHAWRGVPEPAAAVDADAIAVTLRAFWGSNDCPEAYTQAYPVSMYRTSDGTLAWQTSLADPNGRSRCSLVSRPAFDSAGDVLVTVDEFRLCPGSDDAWGCGRNTLFKLARSDGHVIWRADEDGHTWDADRWSVAGNDVLRYGPFAGSTDTVRRISGADGHMVWSSTVFSGDGISSEVHRVDDTHVVVFPLFYGSGRWALLDTSTGATDWLADAGPQSCSYPACYDSAAVVLPGGDLLYPAERDYGMAVKRLHNDGSGTIETHAVGANSASVVSALLHFVRDGGGQLHALLYRKLRREASMSLSGNVTFVASFDPASGVLGAQQAVGAFNGYDDDSTSLVWLDALARPIDTLAMPVADHLIGRTIDWREPMPSTTSTRMIDLAVTAHGNLAAHVDVDRTHVAPGDHVSFVLRATYTGDAPIEGAHLAAMLPWSSGVSDVVCVVQSASACTVDIASGNVDATFDIAPGGSIEVRGNVRVLDIEAIPLLSAMAYGPSGLAEQDTIDNFAGIVLAQSLFVDGFEAH